MRRNQYDGVLEYWIVIRETGRHAEALYEEEIKQSRKKACSHKSHAFARRLLLYRA